MLNIQSTKNTPLVLIDFNQLLFEMRGISNTETPLDFYQPIFNYIYENFYQVNQSVYMRYPSLTLHFYMNYIGMQDFEMIRQIDWIFYQIKEFKTYVYWYYNPDDECSTDYANDVEMTFLNDKRLIPYTAL